jgi:hypothetical protein
MLNTVRELEEKLMILELSVTFRDVKANATSMHSL